MVGKWPPCLQQLTAKKSKKPEQMIFCVANIMKCSQWSVTNCRSAGDEKVAGVNDSVASGNESQMASGDITMDSIKDHAKYGSE